jgi:SNF2 family DNA or RNA helicase
MQSPDPWVLIAQPAAMAHGLTLTAANTIIWYAPPNSNEIYGQANARIVRPGQTENTFIIHIEGTSVEREAYRRLERQERLQGALLDAIQRERQNVDA